MFANTVYTTSVEAQHVTLYHVEEARELTKSPLHIHWSTKTDTLKQRHPLVLDDLVL